jgi:hypothetical protein
VDHCADGGDYVFDEISDATDQFPDEDAGLDAAGTKDGTGWSVQFANHPAAFVSYEKWWMEFGVFGGGDSVTRNGALEAEHSLFFAGRGRYDCTLQESAIDRIAVIHLLVVINNASEVAMNTRPGLDEYVPLAETYIRLVPDGNLKDIRELSGYDRTSLFKMLPLTTSTWLMY